VRSPERSAAGDSPERAGTGTYVQAIAFGLVEPSASDSKEYDRAAHDLAEDIEKRGDRLSTGFIGTKSLMQALSLIGRDDVAFRLLHNDTFPSWGFSIDAHDPLELAT
jgi:alpha-L-rhamnosidase